MSEQDRALSALMHLDSGREREYWVKAGMAAHAAGLSFDDFHSWSAPAGNYKSENDCLTVWKSFKDSGGVSAASLYQMAFITGWKDTKRAQAANGSRASVPVAAPRKAPVTPIKQSDSGNASHVWQLGDPATNMHGYI